MLHAKAWLLVALLGALDAQILLASQEPSSRVTVGPVKPLDRMVLPMRGVRGQVVVDARRSSFIKESPLASWSVESRKYHAKPELAKEDAYGVARDQITSYLRALKPDSNWFPDSAFIRRWLVKEEPVTYSQDLEPPVGVVYRAKMDIELSQRALEEMLQRLRLEEAGQRQWLLGKWLMGAMACCLCLGIYLKVEEYTKGYLTVWLRLGVAGLFVAAVAFLRWLP